MLDFLSVAQPPLLRVFNIVTTQPAAPGWFACYLASEGTIIVVPIILWATIEEPYEEDPNLTLQKIRHFVAFPNGDIVDYEDPVEQFLCVVPPGEDPKEVAIQAATALSRMTKGPDENFS